jgi:hypothetical protein
VVAGEPDAADELAVLKEAIVVRDDQAECEHRFQSSERNRSGRPYTPITSLPSCINDAQQVCRHNLLLCFSRLGKGDSAM